MNRIRELRTARGMKQEELGALVNMGKGAISKYEAGQRQPDPATILALCDIFGCTADYLLGRSAAPWPVVSDQDAAVLEAYHALPLEIRRAVDSLMAPYMPAASSEEKTGS